MIPVDQSVIDAGSGLGNCFSACVASLLEMPIENVPTFHLRGERDNVWMSRLDAWLEPFGLYALHFEIKPAHHEFVTEGIYKLRSAEIPGRGLSVPPNVLYIRAGLSPRGHQHAVIAKGHYIVHDPSPTKTGLLSTAGFCLLIPRWD